MIILTPKLGLRKPDYAEPSWHTPVNENADLLEGLAPLGSLAVRTAEIPSTSRNVKVAAGRYRKPDGSIGNYAGTASFAIAASSTVKLYLTAAGVLTAAAAYPTTGLYIPLAQVATDATTVIGIVDERVTESIAAAVAAPAYGAPTGTATRTTFDTATVTLPQLAERMKALIDDLKAQGKLG